MVMLLSKLRRWNVQGMENLIGFPERDGNSILYLKIDLSQNCPDFKLTPIWGENVIFLLRRSVEYLGAFQQLAQ
jgi:hypothetical protein